MAVGQVGNCHALFASVCDRAVQSTYTGTCVLQLVTDEMAEAGMHNQPCCAQASDHFGAEGQLPICIYDAWLLQHMS